MMIPSAPRGGGTERRPLSTNTQCAQISVRRTRCHPIAPRQRCSSNEVERDTETGLRSRVKNGVQAAAGFFPLCSVSSNASRLRTTTAHQGMEVLVRMWQEMEVERRATRRERISDGDRNRRQNRIAVGQPATVEMGEPRAGEGPGTLAEPRLQGICAVV